MMVQCQKCEYWQIDGQTWASREKAPFGQCLRYAPRPQIEGHATSEKFPAAKIHTSEYIRWPKTDRADACGEGVEIKKQK